MAVRREAVTYGDFATFPHLDHPCPYALLSPGFVNEPDFIASPIPLQLHHHRFIYAQFLMASQPFGARSATDTRSRIALMTAEEFREFCETCPGFINYFSQLELDQLVQFGITGSKALHLTVDMWTEMGLPRMVAVSLRIYISLVAPSDSAMDINMIPQFIIRAKNEEWEWTQSS